mgnify:CR=1 FL=1
MVDTQKNFQHEKLSLLGENVLGGNHEIKTPVSKLEGAERALQLANWDPKTCLKIYDDVMENIPEVDSGGWLYPDVSKLNLLLHQLTEYVRTVDNAIDNLQDELEACKHQYFSLAKLTCETEGWIRIYRGH